MDSIYILEIVPRSLSTLVELDQGNCQIIQSYNLDMRGLILAKREWGTYKT